MRSLGTTNEAAEKLRNCAPAFQKRLSLKSPFWLYFGSVICTAVQCGVVHHEFSKIGSQLNAISRDFDKLAAEISAELKALSLEVEALSKIV